MRRPHKDKAWLEFVDWCRTRRLRPLPAHPWTIAAYARWCEPRHRFTTILKYIRIIARVHLLKCERPPDRHPIVLRTLRLLESKTRAKRQGSALFSEADALAPALLSGVPDNDDEPAAGPSVHRLRMRATPKLVARRPKTPEPQ